MGDDDDDDDDDAAAGASVGERSREVEVGRWEGGRPSWMMIDEDDDDDGSCMVVGALPGTPSSL